MVEANACATPILMAFMQASWAPLEQQGGTAARAWQGGLFTKEIPFSLWHFPAHSRQSAQDLWRRH